MDRPSLIEMLRKLIAHQQSAAQLGNLAEAEAFAEKVSTLLRKHKLEMSELEYEAMKDEEVASHLVTHGGLGRPYRKHETWLETLSTAVAEANCCRVILAYRGNSYYIVGSETNRKVAEFLFVVLARAATRLSLEALRAHRKRTRRPAKTFRASYLNGFALCIRDRLREKPEEGTGLVRLKDEMRRVDAFIAPQGTTKVVHKRPRLHRSAFTQGWIAGGDADLGIRGMGDGPRQKLLDGGTE
jgi:hypothetical protein